MYHNEFISDKPGEVILRKLFYEFTVLSDKKIETILSSESLEKPLAKWLQRGEDQIFDQLLTAFGTAAEHCLPSQLRLLFEWHQRQMAATAVFAEDNQRIIKLYSEAQFSSKSGSLTKSNIQSLDNSDLEIFYILEKRDLAVEFIFCLVLIEVLKQLHLHPGYEDLTNHIENLAFKHFKFREDLQSNPNIVNINMIADLYAEVIGVLAQSRFQSVRKRFMSEFKELRCRELGPMTTHSIISLLMGMKFFRIKMVPIEEFEASFQFMHECALYFQDVKDKDIKHALAGLFVEILVPVAATVKNEVNVPCLKNFVELLYSPCLDLCTKKKHCLALFPLVTCLLCVSQKAFFLFNWHYFLAMCLSHLKNRDSKMSRVALESLYRLLWVYMIRIKCESNAATQSRLHSIVNSLFPKGSKNVVPRDTPLNIFVKIIQFIAQERLDFAMKEIVFDLLSVGRSIKMVLTPERMSIGLRSFLVVADSLQQKDGEPPMPRTLGVLPSGNTLRVKKTFLNKMLTDEMAKNIGMNHYYPYVRKTLSDILRALDIQFGKPLMMTTNVKEPDDMLSGERKPKIDLFRTCVAAIPRLIPDGISKNDLIDLLSRLTINIDEEMNVLAFQALQNLVVDFDDWREDVIQGFVNFILHEINDTFQELLSNALRMLLQLLTSWKNTIQQQQTPINSNNLPEILKPSQSSKTDQIANVLYNVEAFGLVMLCHYRPNRRLVSYILKEVRIISNLLLTPSKNYDEPVATIIDITCPLIIENCFPYISSSERASIIAMCNQVDLQWLADRNNASWTSLGNDSNNLNQSSKSINCTNQIETKSLAEVDSFEGFPHQYDDELKLNAWNVWLMSIMGQVIKHCPNAIAFSWPIICQRLNTLFTNIEPNPINDNRASSILRPASNLKRLISTQERNLYMDLWKSYLMFACSIAPSSITTITSAPENCASPDSLSEKLSSIEGNRSPIMNRGISVQSLFNKIIPLLRYDQYDLRNAVVLGLSQVNQYALADLLEELLPYFREAIDKKQENVRRRKRREILRIQIGRLFKFISERKIFAQCPVVLDRNGSLNNPLIEYIDGMRSYFETENEKECSNSDIKESFCHFICNLLKSFPIDNRETKLSKDLRHNLFNLFASWSGKHGNMFLNQHSSSNRHHLNQHRNEHYLTDFTYITELEFLSIRSMAAVLSAGPMFDMRNLLDGNSLYMWLTNLLNTSEKRINEIGLETLVLLLENNTEADALLEWLIECCYTKNAKIADICFTSLATIFSIREYPCDRYIAIIIVTMINVASPRVEIQQLALQLLQILDNRFFISSNNFKDYNCRLLQEQPKQIDQNATLTSAILNPNSDDCSKSGPSVKDCEPLLSDLYRYSMSDISQRMAFLHPQLTMIVFSEITYRFQTARPNVCQNLLEFLIPWLYNMQLVDATYQQNVAQQNPEYTFHNSHETHNYGWGSIESTQMVLNNLLYITVKFGDDYPKELEKVWASLCQNRPSNLKIIFRYLFIITGLSPNELLPYAKRICIYLAKAQPERVIDELMTDLQAVELLSFNAERTEAFPYFRIVNRKSSAVHLDDDYNNTIGGHSSTNVNHHRGTTGDDNSRDTSASAPITEIGTLHTKRHSNEFHTKSYDFDALANAGTKVDSHRNYDSLNESVSSDEYNVSFELPNDDSLPMSDRYLKPSTPQPRPLPMPEYGGYYAPLKELLSGKNCSKNLNTNNQTTQQPIGFHRCFLALMFLSDIITQDIHVDWTPNIPLMLHIIFLGLDHSKMIVYEHCKQLLLNLLVVCCKHEDNLSVARILLKNRIQKQNFGLSIQSIFAFQSNSSGEQKNSEIDLNKIFTKSSENLVSSNVLTTSESVHLNDVQLNIVENNNRGQKINLYINSLIDFISSKSGGPLWNNEDITAKVWSVKSAEQISTFVEHVLCIFKEFLPLAKIDIRWADAALWQSLQCSSRHYAGRSLQIFRALKIPMNHSMFTDVLSRLVETVSEQGEDMQGYVTELMLTLESAVDTLDYKQRSILELINEYFHFDTNDSDAQTYVVDSNLCIKDDEQKLDSLAEHLKGPIRSTSYSMSFPTRKFNFLDNRSREHYPRFCTLKDVQSFYNDQGNIAMSRSLSAQSLTNLRDDNPLYTLDDKYSMVAQFFCIGVILLETEYEHEFLLALRLLDKCLQKLPLDDPECEERIEKIFVHIKWPNFPGVHQLMLKGLASNLSYEPTINLLQKLTPYLRISVIDTTKSEAFPFHVMAMLPYLLHNYDEPNVLCIQASVSFAKWCNEVLDKNLENLATVMTLYSKRCFSKENSQWTKCVVKYLYDAYPNSFLSITSFLVEVAEKGPPVFLNHILSILHFMLNYIDINAIRLINDDLMRVATKYIESPLWKDALKILKLAVSRSSTLAAPSYTCNFSYAPSIATVSSIMSCSSYKDGVNITSSPFADTEFGSIKRELPGRTMDFTFDIGQAPIVGSKFIAKRKALSDKNIDIDSSKDVSESGVSSMTTENELKPVELINLFNEIDLNDVTDNSNNSETIAGNSNVISASTINIDNATLKRSSIAVTQTRIRERLVNLFNRCGKRIVGLPKSPSVIFSQNSDVVENHKSSMASSTEDISATNNDVSGDSKHDDNTHGEFAYFKEFDFLEYELESQEGESLDNFNWGVRRKSLSNLDDDVSVNKTIQMNNYETTEPASSISYNGTEMKNDDVDESSDDEVQSVSPIYDDLTAHNQLQDQLPEQSPDNKQENSQSRPASLASHGSTHSLVSEPMG